MQLRAQHEREEMELQEKVSIRRALLEEKVPVLVECIICENFSWELQLNSDKSNEVPANSK